MPIIRFRQTMTPKWISLIPYALDTGSKIGTIIKIAGLASISIPRISRKMLTNNRNNPLLEMISKQNFVTVCGICRVVMDHPIALEMAMINRTFAVDFAARMQLL